MPASNLKESNRPKTSTAKADLPSVNRWGPETRENKKPASAKGAFKLEYPFFRTKLFQNRSIKHDRANIPIAIHPTHHTEYYNPELIVSYGLFQFIHFIEEGEIPGRYEALRIAEWLIENLSEWCKHIYAWPHKNDFPFYRVKSPWISAKTHGLALSLFLRIAYLNNDALFEDIAKKIVRLFFLPVEDGGLVRQLSSGGLAYEEYPTARPSTPLFGHLYSLIGLCEYVQYFDDNDVQTILQGGLRGLKENLPKYDLGKWLLFDLHASKRCASAEEIKKNCTLLKILSTLTDDDDYAAVAQKWFTYTQSPTCKRYYFFHKLWEKIRLRVSAKKYGIDKKHLKVAPR